MRRNAVGNEDWKGTDHRKMSEVTPKKKKAKMSRRTGWAVKQGKANLEKLNAIHEAGHAVMAELLSLNPVYVTIEPTGRSEGHLRRRGGAITADENWQELIVICAGAIAEGIYSPKVNSRFRLLSGISLGAHDKGTDGKHLWDALRAHSANPQQQLDWYELA